MGFLSFQHESAGAYLDFLAIDMALLCNVEASMPGLGDGTGLMKVVCEFLDRNRMTCILYVHSDGPDGCMDNDQLIKWYEKFDFKLQYSQEGRPPQMARYPQEIKHVKAAYQRGNSSFKDWFRSLGS